MRALWVIKRCEIAVRWGNPCVPVEQAGELRRRSDGPLPSVSLPWSGILVIFGVRGCRTGWDNWDSWDIGNVLRLYLHKPVGRDFLTFGTFGTFGTLEILGR